MADLPKTFEGPVHIAVIGGTGFNHLPNFTAIASLPLSHPQLYTPWGTPSSPITIFSHPGPSGQHFNVAFLSRHGLHHEIAPHEIPSRANIASLRKLGVRCIIAFSAVGSLKEEVKPRDFIVPDQVIDRTHGVRPSTYFEKGVVGHIGFADPFDNALREVIIKATGGQGVLQGEGVSLHEEGTLVSMEGPQFSTRAESQLYRSWQASCVSMTCLPEAKLAREAELSYAMICMCTDYDSWHSTNETVSVDMVMGHMKANGENAGRVASAVLDVLGRHGTDIEELREGKHWEGQTRLAAGITKVEGRNKETNAKLAWLFPDLF